MASLGQIAKAGWKADSIKAGDKITVEMHPLKNGSRGGQYVSANWPTDMFWIIGATRTSLGKTPFTEDAFIRADESCRPFCSGRYRRILRCRP